MSKKKDLVKNVLAGEIAISECNLEDDFSLPDLKLLLDKRVVSLSELPQWKVTELLVEGLLSFADYPFERLDPPYQLWLLQEKKIEEKEFLAKVDLTSYSNRDWLTLLAFLPDMRLNAPWERLCAEATAEEWTSAILICPELLHYADEDRLNQICTAEQLNDIDDAMEMHRDMLEFKNWLKMNSQSDFDLKPENDVEEAIMARDYVSVVKILMTRMGGLKRPDIFAKAEFLQAPTAVAALIVQRCASPELLDGFKDFWSAHSIGRNRVMTIIETTKMLLTKSAPLMDRPLLAAIKEHADDDVQKLARYSFLSISQDFGWVLPELRHLKKDTLVNLFYWGIPAVMKAPVMFLLLDECQSPQLLEDYSHEERLMLANLMIHVIMGEITPDDKERIEEDWYPLGNSASLHSYSYYYDLPDPQTETGGGDDGYETPSHQVRHQQ